MESLGSIRNYSHRTPGSHHHHHHHHSQNQSLNVDDLVGYETVPVDAANTNNQNNDDDDPILTATITFDVTVDPNGQVISTSEGQIIAEGIHQPIDGRTLNLLEHNPIPIAQITSGQINGGSGIQADSLTSMNSGMCGTGGGGGGLNTVGSNVLGNIRGTGKDLTILQDSLDESESDAESTSTSTESLIERSKRYMNQEAGIIILKRENSQVFHYFTFFF